MRRTPSPRRPALGAAIAAAASVITFLVFPAVGHAQQGGQGDTLTPARHGAVASPEEAPVATTRTHAPATRVVAEYRVRNARRGFPQAFVVVDSAGRLAARYRTADDPAPRELDVQVAGADLVLRGATAEGPIMVVLEGEAEGRRDARASFRGRWYHRGAEGPLSGRAPR